MIRTLIKLPIKLALLPLKVILRKAGILRAEEPAPAARPAPPPRAAAAPPPAPPPVPDDIEVQGKDVVGSDGLVFVDVREQHELRASGKVPGAVHMPLRDVPRRFEELDKDADIVLYCAAGMRSFDAAMFLRDKGYESARSLVGGLPGWSAAGGELEQV